MEGEEEGQRGCNLLSVGERREKKKRSSLNLLKSTLGKGGGKGE